MIGRCTNFRISKLDVALSCSVMLCPALSCSVLTRWQRSLGLAVCLSCGLLVSRSLGLSVSRSLGLAVSRSFGLSVSRSLGLERVSHVSHQERVIWVGFLMAGPSSRNTCWPKLCWPAGLTGRLTFRTSAMVLLSPTAFMLLVMYNMS